MIDLRAYEDSDKWLVVREGAVTSHAVEAALAGQFHFDPAGYADMIRADIPVYEQLQAEVASASGVGARRVLELGTGTGETAAALLDRHRDAELVGIDESSAMLAAARSRLRAQIVFRSCVGRLEEPLPEGPFDLVASALCVHHLSGAEKRDLFARVAGVLGPGGRFVLGDVIVPEDPDDAVTSLTPDFDEPSPLSDQLRWLAAAGFNARVVWRHRDLAVISADLA